MSRRKRPLHREVKRALGHSSRTPDATVLADWLQRTRQACKPCWELKYCPYGPLVEDFPLPPLTRDEVTEHHSYLRDCLKTGRLGDGRPLDAGRRKIFEEDLRLKRDLPIELPQVLEDVRCRVFGHICPVFFVAEGFTETREQRRSGRSIPRDVILKVVRRDGQICQQCHEAVKDDEVEFDHIIPYSKGGTSTAENLRLVHRSCNRRKGNSLDEILRNDSI